MSGLTRTFTLSGTFSQFFAKPFYLYDVETERFFEIGRKSALGRTEGDIRLGDDSRLSGRHLEFDRNGDLLTVRDLESRNGTLLNGAKLTPKTTYRLRQFDILEPGGRRFVVTRERRYIPGMEKGLKPDSGRSRFSVLIRIGSIAALLWIGWEVAGWLSPSIQIHSKPHRPTPLSQPPSLPPSVAIEAPIKDPGISKLGGWDAAVVQAQAGILRLRNPSPGITRPTVIAFRDDSIILARILSRMKSAEHGSILGIPAELEEIANRACALLEARSPLPEMSIDTALKELDAGPSGSAALAIAQGESIYGPLPFALVSARLSTLRTPASKDTLELNSTLLTCRAPAGRRLAVAETLAWPYFASRALQALRYRLDQQVQDRERSITKKTKIEALKGVRLRSLILASRNAEDRLAAFLAWATPSPEVNSVLPDEALAAYRRAAEILLTQTQAQSRQLETEYAQGTAVSSATFPPIRQETRLEERDLFYLGAD